MSGFGNCRAINLLTWKCYPLKRKEYWSVGVLEYWKNPDMLLFSFIPIRSIALPDNQMVNPASSITLRFQALHEFKNPIFQFIGLGIKSFNFRYPRFLFFLITPLLSPSRRIYPPACKPCGLEAEPEANSPSSITPPLHYVNTPTLFSIIPLFPSTFVVAPSAYHPAGSAGLSLYPEPVV